MPISCNARRHRASLVCRVASTRCPVSDAWTATRGVLVADLADHDDIGVLTKNAPQSTGESQPGALNLDLIDQVE